MPQSLWFLYLLYSGICVDELKIFSQKCRLPGRDLNPGPPEHKESVRSTVRQRSVSVLVEVRPVVSCVHAPLDEMLQIHKHTGMTATSW